MILPHPPPTLLIPGSCFGPVPLRSNCSTRMWSINPDIDKPHISGRKCRSVSVRFPEYVVVARQPMTSLFEFWRSEYAPGILCPGEPLIRRENPTTSTSASHLATIAASGAVGAGHFGVCPSCGDHRQSRQRRFPDRDPRARSYLAAVGDAPRERHGLAPRNRGAWLAVTEHPRRFEAGDHTASDVDSLARGHRDGLEPLRCNSHAERH
jgi:hypothetical protein